MVFSHLVPLQPLKWTQSAPNWTQKSSNSDLRLSVTPSPCFSLLNMCIVNTTLRNTLNSNCLQGTETLRFASNFLFIWGTGFNGTTLPSIAAAIFFQSENYTLPEEVKFSASSVTSIGQCRLKWGASLSTQHAGPYDANYFSSFFVGAVGIWLHIRLKPPKARKCRINTGEWAEGDWRNGETEYLLVSFWLCTYAESLFNLTNLLTLY